MRNQKLEQAFEIALIFLVTALLYIPKLNVPAPWRDEMATFVSTNKTFLELFGLFQNVDLAHAFYYLTTKLILINPSLDELRYFSIFWLAVSSVGIYSLVRLVTYRWIAFTSTFLYLLMPTTFIYASDARSYSFTSALTILSFLYLTKYLRQEIQTIHPALILLTLSVLTNVLNALIFVIYLVIVFRQHPKSPQTYFVFSAYASISILFTLAVASQRDQVSWIKPVGLIDPISFINQTFIYSFNVPTQVFYFFLFLGVVGFAISKVVKSRGSQTKPGLQLATNLLLMIFGPAFLVLTASSIVPLWHPRYVFYSVAFFAALLGLVLASLPLNKVLAVFLIITSFSFWGQNHWWYRSENSKDVFPYVVSQIEELSASTQNIWFVEVSRNDSTARVLNEYSPEVMNQLVDFSLNQSWAPSDSIFPSGKNISSISDNKLPERFIEVAWICPIEEVVIQEKYLDSIGYKTIDDRSFVDACWHIKLWQRSP